MNFVITLSREALQDEEVLLWLCDCLREYRAKGAWVTVQVRKRDIRARGSIVVKTAALSTVAGSIEHLVELVLIALAALCCLRLRLRLRRALDAVADLGQLSGGGLRDRMLDRMRRAPARESTP